MSEPMFVPKLTKGMVQRRLGGPAAPPIEQGDCWATAVACYAGLDVRDRNELHRRIVLSDLAIRRHRPDQDPFESDGWWNVTQRFLRQRLGLVLATVYERVYGDLHPDAVFLVGGPGPRGVSHEVLMFGDLSTLYWDPHPSEKGITSVTDVVGWWDPHGEGARGVMGR